MNVFGGNVFEEHTVDLSGAVNIKLHPRFGHDMLDISGDILDPAPVLDAKCLHGGRNSQADLIFSSRLSNMEKSIVTQRLITD